MHIVGRGGAGGILDIWTTAGGRRELVTPCGEEGTEGAAPKPLRQIGLFLIMPFYFGGGVA